MKKAICLFFCWWIGTTCPAAAAPFWRDKKPVFKKIIHERAVIVSVKSVDLIDNKKNLAMTAGMLVNRTQEKVYLKSLNYEQLLLISQEHVKKIKWDAAKEELYLILQAYGYVAKMNLKIQAEGGDSLKKIKFRVEQGHFYGMKGEFTFEAHNLKSTIMGYSADYEYTELPFPEFFVQFGLEIILQKVAGRLRSFLEKEVSV